MTVPFADLFNKIRARFLAPAPQRPGSLVSPVRVTKPSGDRRSKTVLPRAPVVSESVAPPALKTFTPPPSPPRTRELPPALAKALEPKLERAITLPLSDFLDQIPPEYVKPVEVIEANRSVTLKASEIEKGMPEQKPSISLTSLYHQIPEIFLRSVAPTDPTRVPLPYDKVLEQFTSFQVRSDQQRDDRVPQLETPILQATIEDTERFGTKIEPVESSLLPPLPVKPATAETIASAEPEAAVSEIVASPSAKQKSPYPVISLHGSNLKSAKDLPTPKSSADKPESSSSKIPFQFPPNGTGAPASERVPASSGPPVPPPSLPPLKLTTDGPVAEKPASEPQPIQPEIKSVAQAKSTPIPFKLGDESDRKTAKEAKKSSIQQSSEPTSTPPAPEVSGEERPSETVTTALESAQGQSPTIELALKPLLENVPVFQRDGDPGELPENVRVKFSIDLIQSQLASGRILVPAKEFKRALPPAYRSLFAIDPEETPVSLPLHEVLKNLPAGALKLRDDQEKSLLQDDFVTPISLKAKEDAERFQSSTASSSSAAATAPTAKSSVDDSSKSEAASGEEEIDGKQVVAEACALPGVSACELMFPDGLSLAGNLPAEIGADGLCAMAPALLQRVDTHMSETKLGSLAAVTLHTTGSAITFFMSENIYLAALHKEPTALPADTRAKLDSLVEMLSRKFTQPEIPHVDH